MSTEKIYVAKRPISYMGTKIERGEEVKMPIEDAENIGSSLVAPAEEAVDVSENDNPAEPTPAEESQSETPAAPEETPAEPSSESTKTSTDTAPADGAPEGGDNPAEPTPNGESADGEIVV